MTQFLKTAQYRDRHFSAELLDLPRSRPAGYTRCPTSSFTPGSGRSASRWSVKQAAEGDRKKTEN